MKPGNKSNFNFDSNLFSLVYVITKNWTNSDQDRGYWRALVDAISNLQVS